MDIPGPPVVPRSGVYTPTDNANQQYGANGEPLLTAVTIMGWGRSEGTPYWLAGELRRAPELSGVANLG